MYLRCLLKLTSFIIFIFVHPLMDYELFVLFYQNCYL